MRTIFLIIAYFLSFNIFGQNNHIILTKDQADQIKGKYGLYSEIIPIETPDGNYIVPEKCLSDPDLKDAKKKLEEIQKVASVQNITDMEVGKQVEKDKYYISDIGLVKCLITHIRTTDKVQDLKTYFLCPTIQAEVIK